MFVSNNKQVAYSSKLMIAASKPDGYTSKYLVSGPNLWLLGTIFVVWRVKIDGTVPVAFTHQTH